VYECSGFDLKLALNRLRDLSSVMNTVSSG